MNRPLLNLLTGFSLLLCVAVAGLWVRGMMYFDEWWWCDVRATGYGQPAGTEEVSHVALAHGDGVAAVQWGASHRAGSARRGYDDRRGWDRRDSSSHPPDLHLLYHADRQFAGFGWTDRRHSRGSLTAPGVPADPDQGYVVERYRIARVPLWFPLLLTAAMPASRAARFMARVVGRRLNDGLCPRCGYDLRATPDRCPECGHEPAGANA